MMTDTIAATTTQTRLQLLGEFALLDCKGNTQAIALRRGQALLAYLALKETRSEKREVLVDLLWPDRFKEQAQASLRQVLFELRTAKAGGAPLVEANRTSVMLGEGVTSCDVWELEGPPQGFGLDGAEQLLALYRGPLLDGSPIGSEPFEQWAAIQRSRLEGRLESVVLGATSGEINPHEQDRAAKALLRLIAISPMCWEAVQRLMSMKVMAGSPYEARQHYERYARRLKLEFEEEPPEQLRQAYEKLKAAPASKMPSVSVRRPAFVHKDPWVRGRSDGPVIAVLPFRYDGRDPGGPGLAAALSEDITIILSGCKWFSVLSRATAHSHFSSSPFVPKDFAHLTGAKYLVYGAIVERADGLSLGIELTDAEMGHICWASRYDAATTDLHAWAGDVSPVIVSAIDPAIADIERRTFAKPALAATGSAVAYQHLVQGYRHYYAADFAAATAALQSAIREDATYAHAHAMLAVTTYVTAQLERDHRWPALLARAEQAARRALEIDPSEPKGCNVMGQILDWQGRHDEAVEYLERAVSLNPSFSMSSTARSYHACMTGDYEAAKSLIQTAMRLRVGDASLGLCLPSKVLADLHLGNTAEALPTAHWAVRMAPDFWLGRQVLAACLSMAGDEEAARRLTDGLRRDYPGLTVDEFVNWFPYARGTGGEPVREALWRAGWR